MSLSFSIVVFSTQSITSEDISGDKINSRLTPVLTVKSADISVLWMTLQTLCISQFQQCPCPPGLTPGVGTHKLSKCPGVGTKKEGKCPAPGIVAFQHFCRFLLISE